MSKNFVQVHTKSVQADIETGLVTVVDVDLSELLSHFSTGDVLDTLEFSDVVDYVTQKRLEDSE